MTGCDAIVLGAGAPGEHGPAAIATGGLPVAVVERAPRHLDRQLAQVGPVRSIAFVGS